MLMNLLSIQYAYLVCFSLFLIDRHLDEHVKLDRLEAHTILSSNQ